MILTDAVLALALAECGSTQRGRAPAGAGLGGVVGAVIGGAVIGGAALGAAKAAQQRSCDSANHGRTACR